MGESGTVIRVMKDLAEIAEATNMDAPPIWAEAFEGRADHAVALVMGPADTPYHFGFFLFDIRLPETYPNHAPKVRLTTTDYGRVRFNPNLYADGKVCLSILGTWKGEGAEVWRSSFSMQYVLTAIQSLIMNSTPYRNEPGYEGTADDADGSHPPPSAAAAAAAAHPPAPAEAPASPPPAGGGTAGPAPAAPRDPAVAKVEMEAYNAKITHETLRVAVCDVLELALAGRLPHFAPQVKREFLTRYHTYVRLCAAHVAKGLDGRVFPRMPFEYNGNVADGKYAFQALLDRLAAIRAKLDEETQLWRVSGLAQTARRSYAASALREERRDFDGASGGPTSPDNVFVWTVAFFGGAGTVYEEGVFHAEIVLPEDPNECVRVRFLTPMLHPSISPDGYPVLILPAGRESATDQVISAVIRLLRAEPSASSAAHVDVEAARMCFSRDEATRAEWRRRVRDLARRSADG